MLKKYRQLDLSFKAPRGNWLIETNDGKIIVKLVHPDTGKELEVFEGKDAQTVRRKIAEVAEFENSYHAMYVGQELQRAENALKNNEEYEQDVGLE